MSPTATSWVSLEIENYWEESLTTDAVEIAAGTLPAYFAKRHSEHAWDS